MKTAEKREPTVLRGVTQRYGEKTVFSDVSLTVEPGARLALMAPSGAGKTTLLRLLMGLEMPTGGTVTGVPRRVAAVFQEDRLVEEATVLRNVMLVLPRRAARARATEILTALGLGGELSSLAGTLSGGMKRRVALARALAAESEMLVLDEPLTGLDAETKREALGVIGRYLGTRTLVLVTHDASEAEALGAERVTIGG